MSKLIFKSIKIIYDTTVFSFAFVNAKKSKPIGREAFIAYYQTAFGDEGTLAQVLSHHSQPIVRFASKNQAQLAQLWQAAHLPWQPLSWCADAVRWPTDIPAGTTLPGHDQHLFYLQNASSLLPVLALAAQPGDTILDACAAPGGKGLYIAEQIHYQGTLMLNDSSPARSQRIQRIFEEHQVPPCYHITKGNAATIFRQHPEHFDRILLDAPCSSEKHVWQSAEHLKQWSYGRIRRLAQQQYALLSGLWRALKPGGRLVYSTCALNQEENELVIDKFLKKYSDTVRTMNYPQTLPGYQTNSAYGRISMDSLSNDNLDPMFIAILEKTTAQGEKD
ncbi:RsmB/NOP family class I SAM-dependent RNA methyltransferase [Candidatus Gracilibacteria bacterium]|nr:RsmB/NOP family class I SAM-dependent RNA methyltransferase [Candidatus Gracilibacteria bacterium]